MAIPIIMPRQGQSVETCIITQWFKHKGDTVKTGELLFSYETDKASFDVEATGEGKLLEVFFNDGDEVPVLTNVGVIGKAGENTAAFRPGNITNTLAQTGSSPESGHQPEASVPTAVQVSAKADIETLTFRISPRARVMAAKLGINPCDIAGTGPNGRIIARDIEQASIAGTAHAGISPTPDHKSLKTGFEDKKLSNVRKIIARTMHESLSTSAQLTHHLSADVRKILAYRKTIKEELSKGIKSDITLNDMVCYAVIRALEKFPEINSHFLGEHIRTFHNVNLGLAVDTPRGLMVPAVINASDYSLKALSERLREVAELCRSGKVDPDLLQSNAASFTVSNLGNYGVEMFTPIINLPQVAILGVNTITYRPADLGDGTIGFVPMMGLSLTYDHRAVDGGPATLFLREIKKQIEEFMV
ncbi:MAG: 2-oxo acid dehydrogenase subunit E2 [Bacteroidales bacterium]|nr:2-oxo acid dehydrogenase subunit E2 [Bacteroidales bacterium]